MAPSKPNNNNRIVPIFRENSPHGGQSNQRGATSDGTGSAPLREQTRRSSRRAGTAPLGSSSTTSMSARAGVTKPKPPANSGPSPRTVRDTVKRAVHLGHLGPLLSVPTIAPGQMTFRPDRAPPSSSDSQLHPALFRNPLYVSTSEPRERPAPTSHPAQLLSASASASASASVPASAPTGASWPPPFSPNLDQHTPAMNTRSKGRRGAIIPGTKAEPSSSGSATGRRQP